MPFGIDTPTLFAMVFGVLGPVKVATGDPVLAWKVGMAITIAIGVVKTGSSFAGDWVRRVVPRAALLGSIAGVAILLIAFLPMLKILRDPLVGLVALVVLLLALLGQRADAVRPARRVRRGAGRDAGLLAAGRPGWHRARRRPPSGRAPGAGDPVADAGVARRATDAALPYLSIALPFALVTIVGGIDNTESAAAAGDEYRTRDILLAEALATVLAGLRAAGSSRTRRTSAIRPTRRWARARATRWRPALVIGVGASVGALGALVSLLPEAAVAPILVFIGLEITAQAFLASPARHGAAVALAFVPVAAAVVLIEVGAVLGGARALGRRSHRRGGSHLPRAARPRQRLHSHGRAVGHRAGVHRRAAASSAPPLVFALGSLATPVRPRALAR